MYARRVSCPGILLVHLDGFRQQRIHSRMPTLDTSVTLRRIESGPQLFYAYHPAKFVTQFVLKLLSTVRQEFTETAQREDHSLHKTGKAWILDVALRTGG